MTDTNTYDGVGLEFMGLASFRFWTTILYQHSHLANNKFMIRFAKSP